MYNAENLNNLRQAGVDHLVFSIVNGQPNLYFQDNASSGSIYFATDKITGMPMYLLKVGEQYQRTTYANVTNCGFYYLTPEFDTWLNDNTQGFLFENVNITLTNGTFKNIFINKKPGSVFSVDIYNNLHESYASQWSQDVTNFSGNYDIKLFNSTVTYITINLDDNTVSPTVGNAFKVVGTLQYSKLINCEITLTIGNLHNTYKNIFLTKGLDQITKTDYVFENITGLIAVPPTDISTYLNSIPAGHYDFKLNPTWLTPLFETGIKDYIMSLSVLNAQSTQIETVSPNIIYSKSLYENSETFFDTAINRLNEALLEEQTINNILKENYETIDTSVQSFIETNSTEITNKLNNITSLYNQIETLVTENNNYIQNSSVLNSFEANALSKKILDLRDKVYNSINLLGNRHNTVYILNKITI